MFRVGVLGYDISVGASWLRSLENDAHEAKLVLGARYCETLTDAAVRVSSAAALAQQLPALASQSQRLACELQQAESARLRAEQEVKILRDALNERIHEERLRSAAEALKAAAQEEAARLGLSVTEALKGSRCHDLVLALLLATG